MADVLVGVDGGGTRTRVMLTDFDGNVIARGDGPATLVDRDQPGKTALLLDTIVRRTIDEAGVSRPVAAMWAGLAGAGQGRVREILTSELGTISRDLIRQFEIGTDVDAAVADAFGDSAGIVLIAGTGSVVLVSRPDGSRFTVGGWGARLGDEGSGFALATAALRAVLRAHDGRGMETALRELLEVIGLSRPEELVDWISRATKREVAALAPEVVRIATDGDSVAERLRAECVEELRKMLYAAILGLGTDFPGVRDVAFVGGLIKPGRPLRLEAERVARDLGLQVVDRDVIPERGAARLAAKLFHAGSLSD